MERKDDKKQTSKPNGKMSLEEFKKSQFLESTIHKKIEDYTDEDIKDQINMLKSAIELIKTDKKNKKTLPEIEEKLYKYLRNMFFEIEQPGLNDFFRLITFERMLKGQKVDIAARVKAILESGKDIHSIDSDIDKNDNAYTGDLDKNIDILLCELICELATYEYSISEKFNNMRSKIKRGELTVSDVPLLTEYLKRMIETISIGRTEECQRILKNDIDELYYRLINNMDKFFEVHEETVIRNVDEQVPDELPVSIDELRKFANSSNNKREIVTAVGSRSPRYVTLKKCITNPFISNDKKNNMDIYIYSLLENYSRHPGWFNDFYNLLRKSRKDEDVKKYIKDECFKKDLKYDHSSMHVRALLSERIAKLMDLYEQSGKIDDYNGLNNKRLSDKNLERLTIDTSQLLEILKSLEKANTISTEAIIAMSAFYANRLTKIWPIFARIKFILDKKNLIKAVYENPDLTYEDFEFSEEEIKLYMAQYDTLQQILQDGYVSKLSDSEIYKLEFDAETREKAKTLYASSLAQHAISYNNLYGTFEQDAKNVSPNCEIPRKFYALKNANIKSLIYTALTDKKHNIINWGYVPYDESGDNKRMLIGFDIKYLNMPVFFHIKERDLAMFISDLTGDTKIPVYEGDIDMYDFSEKKRITTLVLFPVPSTLRKNIELRPKDKARTLIEHLRWLQKPKNRPVFIGEPGSKVYDFATKKISKKKKTKNDQDDPDSQDL